ncbi:MAG: hypothetical protein HY597_06205 [Candidatus Omnitrophica bacterium]|nr:hypothetical protein [Candidatus Omnitrophota bacterium]
MATILIAGIALGGMLLTFTNYLIINDSSQALNLATNMAVQKAEEMRKVAMTDFSQVQTLYVDPAPKIFAVDGLPPTSAMGSYTIAPDDALNPALYNVVISICWLERGGRVARGEDKNLNGVLDPGEDLDNDGQIDAPVQLAFAIARR